MNAHLSHAGAENADMTVAECVNVLARFCGVRDVPALTREELSRKYPFDRADVMVLFGGSILCGGDVLAEAMRAGVACTYVIVGGCGHTTDTLRRKMHEAIPSVDFSRMQEAEAFETYLEIHFGLHANFLETKSTNCGNNITNLLALLEREGVRCESAILTQDVSMQRRMDAGMRRYRPEVCVVNYAAYRAEVRQQGEGLAYACDIPGMWDMDRYISLLMGEIPRLTDDGNGYGPNGAGFIAHVDVDPEVEKAYGILKKLYRPREADPAYA